MLDGVQSRGRIKINSPKIFELTSESTFKKMESKEGNVYRQTEDYNCGPAAYMGSFYQGRKSKEVENELHSIGRINPSRIFLGPSFLKINPSLNLYTTNMGLTEGVLRLTHNPEIRDFREKMFREYSGVIESNRGRVHKIKGIGDIKNILDETVAIGKKALLLTHSGQWLEGGMPHWISVLGRNKDYKIGDPYTGKILNFSELQLERGLKMLKGTGFPLQVVTDFKR